MPDLSALSLLWPATLLLLPLPLLIRWLLAATSSALSLPVPFYRQLSAMQQQGFETAAPTRKTLRIILLWLMWLLLLVASARPVWIGEPVALPVNGRDLMLAVDISGSMEQTDMELNGRAVTRLLAVKKVLNDFLERRAGDRVGLILFGSQAYLQAPLSFDLKTIKTLLMESEIGLAGKSTAIGDAVGLAIKRLRKRPDDQRVLILLTDGANTAGAIEPLKAAELAQLEQLKIYTIGVGATEMTVRGLFGSRRINPSADLDETTLRAIAEQTGGQYFRARNTDELDDIYRLIDQLEPVEQDGEFWRPQRSLIHWPLTGSLICALLLMLIRGYRGGVE